MLVLSPYRQILVPVKPRCTGKPSLQAHKQVLSITSVPLQKSPGAGRVASHRAPQEGRQRQGQRASGGDPVRPYRCVRGREFSASVIKAHDLENKKKIYRGLEWWASSLLSVPEPIHCHLQFELIFLHQTVLFGVSTSVSYTSTTPLVGGVLKG